MGPNSSENFKMILLLQIAAKSFQTCPESSFQLPSSQKYIRDFWNFEFPILNIVFENFKLTIIAYGKKTQLSGKRAILKQNGAKFGTRG